MSHDIEYWAYIAGEETDMHALILFEHVLLHEIMLQLLFPFLVNISAKKARGLGTSGAYSCHY